jgi:hypothetical protein
VRWLARNHRRVEASKKGKTDHEVAAVLARKRENRRERIEAFCI